ncbi:MAG: hypothetical protein QOE22_458 [Candidatus Parcubacteria bacterium]|jgi:hypothetical protein|nr:hypothetical protein [Candidatus Parcubacteria bacterium]
MPPEDADSPLEEMRKRLYAPGPVESAVQQPLRHDIQRPVPVQQGWTPPPPPIVKTPRGWAAMPWTSRFLVVAVGFFLIAGGVAAFLFLHGSRSISAENVAIDTDGPPSIGSGDTVAIVVKVKNNNPATITNTNIVIDLPAGTRQAVDKTQPFDHYTDTLGDLGPGAEASRTVNAVLFGAQNQVLTVPIRVEYKAEASNASFVTEGEYTVTVTTSPLSLTVAAPREAASGEPFTLVVTARSNAPTPLENVGVEVSYPPGFTPTNTIPRPSTGTLFSLGTLAPGAQQNVSINGVLTGQDTDERVFRISAGTRTSADATTIALPYASTDALVQVARPFLATILSLNRDTADTVLAPPGQSVNGTLSWKNNLNVPVSDAQISVRFSGSGFDPAQVFAQSGFYRSSDSTLLFSKDTDPGLVQLLPGDTGNGSFSFIPKSAAALAGVPSPVVMLTVSIAGNRLSQTGVPEAVSSTVTKTVKVGTSVNFTSRLLRSVGPFTNTGPVPPKANAETTYTVELSAVNSVNAIAGAQAVMVLPSYVRFTGAVSPAGSVTYDERTRTVTWRLNDLAGGATGKASFQIAFLPSLSQVGISPVLIPEQTFTATDRFTQGPVSVKSERLTAQFSEDPAYRSGEGLVTQ